MNFNYSYNYSITNQNIDIILENILNSKKHGKIVKRSNELFYVSKVNKTDKVLVLKEIIDNLFTANSEIVNFPYEKEFYKKISNLLRKKLNKLNKSNFIVKFFLNFFLGHTKKYEKNFEEANITIAKYYAKTDPNFAFSILDYNFSKENDRVELAKIAANKNGLNLSTAIKNFNISDEQKRLEIALIALEQNPKSTSEYIEEYQLKENNRLQIAKKIASKNGNAFLKHIKKYNITDEKELNNLIKIALKQKNSKITCSFEFIDFFKIINFYDSRLSEELFEAALEIIQDPKKKKAYEEFICEDKKISSYLKFPALLLFKNNNDIKFQKLKPLFIEIKEFLKDGLFLRNYLCAMKLILNSSTLSLDEILFIIKQMFISADERKTIQEIEHNSKLIHKEIKANKKKSKDVTDLKKEEALLIQKKRNFWSKLKENLQKRQFAIQGIFECDGAKKLKFIIHKEKYLSDSLVKNINLDNICEELLLEIFQLNGINNISQKLLKTFQNGPIPFAVLTYVGCLTKLEQPDRETALKLFTEFVQSLFKGTFKKERYDTKTSNHLEEIFNKYPLLQKNWVESHKTMITELGPEYESWYCENSDDPDDLLLCGTLVDGSCQSINSLPLQNKCLLSYLLDGKNRLLVIKDAKGRMVARSIFRLLLDTNTGKPALLQEMIYSRTGTNEKLKDILNIFAINEAKRLGLPLFKDAGQKCGFILESKDGRGEWNYVDSSSGYCKSTYKILNAKKIFDPFIL